MKKERKEEETKIARQSRKEKKWKDMYRKRSNGKGLLHKKQLNGVKMFECETVEERFTDSDPGPLTGLGQQSSTTP